jgi:hypothetical protein
VALEYGRIDEGQPLDWRGPVGDDMGCFHDGPVGQEVGFKALPLCAIDIDADELSEIWGDPRFDVPMLGLTAAGSREIIVAARAFCVGRSSLGDEFLTRAVEADGEDALELWQWRAFP